ncbi:Asp-tRNA(Asn)/Glu-tRNA(Gln) amidotransferase subunit GatC [Heliorestis acidaminivorans]|uniref:Aspartyl/glutamyl-tRNA(Asn/Gln) amidotransferase subunit C n=1 Tax=Heliorestis acidaminivorans TaxID=553427 RepID=A0A6I0F5W9_9FIRM|nr:Asp-tRNA(Asn)/Glu-tRNA(Gln) amidotransferase subunit GatC [Heliorestis acidaminivorans]KAB2952679.1 Asp-tRNA(Asn)/Glu-tRNA(Gln) amidotransferase subunit GatC [Heliorestis acidaminivorans]
MALTKEEVQHVAKLARLELSEDEVDKYTVQLNAILEYARKLEALDTTNVPPTAHAFPLQNVMREDKVTASMAQEKVVSNAPDEEDGFFKVPRIV